MEGERLARQRMKIPFGSFYPEEYTEFPGGKGAEELLYLSRKRTELR